MKQETEVHRPLYIFALAFMGVCGFSLMSVFVKLASAQHSVQEIIFYRCFFAGVPLFFLTQRHPLKWGLLKSNRHSALLWRAVAGVGAMFLVFWSFQILPLADATALHFAAPLILTALSVPILKEIVGPWRWGAVIVGLIGVIVIANPSGSMDLFGTSIALCAAVGIAIATLMIRKLGSTENALTIVLYFTLYSSIIGAVLLPFYWTTPTATSLFYLIMTGLMGGISQYWMTHAYAAAPPSYVSPFSYFSIVLAALFGWLVWGDVPTMNVLIGAAIVMASGLFILYRETVHKSRIIRTNFYSMQPVSPTLHDLDETSDLDKEASK